MQTRVKTVEGAVVQPCHTGAHVLVSEFVYVYFLYGHKSLKYTFRDHSAASVQNKRTSVEFSVIETAKVSITETNRKYITVKYEHSLLCGRGILYLPA